MSFMYSVRSVRVDLAVSSVAMDVAPSSEMLLLPRSSTSGAHFRPWEESGAPMRLLKSDNGLMCPLLEAPPNGGGIAFPPSSLSPLPLLLRLSPFSLSSLPSPLLPSPLLPSPLLPQTDLQSLAYRPHPRIPQLIAL